ncbi:MAG TPA: IS21 family transposase [Anaerovoracaceae bacterium]|nr:IS21 family transposase [Anaerovoracaceae bacterium]
MSKVKEILRLKFDAGLSLRDIAASCNCGKSTVDDVLKRAQNAKISWPCDLNDKELLSLIYPPAEARKAAAEPDLNYIFSEMKRKHVTLMLLWEEYKRDNPDGLMYTQFCERYRSFKKTNQISLHIEHKAGEEMQLDWAGSTIPYTEPSTGEEKDAYIFVSVLPASAYPFAYAYGDMKQPNWIGAHVRAFEHYGGVPRVIIPDNTKTAVKTPDPVDPQLNTSYTEMAAAHKRNFNTFKRYTTLPEHMPESHKAVTGWSSERYLSWAEKIGPKTRHLIANILDSREYPVQTYRACMGIMRLASDYPSETVEAASKDAIDKGTCTYKYFSIILRQKALKESSEGGKVVSNTNLRGAKSYAGGGMNA